MRPALGPAREGAIEGPAAAGGADPSAREGGPEKHLLGRTPEGSVDQ